MPGWEEFLCRMIEMEIEKCVGNRAVRRSEEESFHGEPTHLADCFRKVVKMLNTNQLPPVGGPNLEGSRWNDYMGICRFCG